MMNQGRPRNGSDIVTRNARTTPRSPTRPTAPTLGPLPGMRVEKRWAGVYLIGSVDARRGACDVGRGNGRGTLISTSPGNAAVRPSMADEPPIVCVVCGTANPPTARDCKQCGIPL